MSNASLIQRLYSLLDSYDPKAISPEAFRATVAFHMDALEGVELAAVHRANELATRIVRAHFFDGEEEFGDPERAQAAVQELREFLAALET